MRFNHFATFPEFFQPEIAIRKQVGNPCKNAVNISETTDVYEIEILLPGFTKEEVTIKVEGNFLNVTAKKAANQSEQKSKKFNHQEFSISDFKRSFEFPNTVAVGDIIAKQNNGLLTLTLPKKPEAKPVNLQIEVQ